MNDLIERLERARLKAEVHGFEETKRALEKLLLAEKNTYAVRNLSTDHEDLWIN